MTTAEQQFTRSTEAAPIRLLTARLDGLIRPHIRFGQRSWSAFKICGSIGLVGGIALTQAVTRALGYSAWVMGGITAAVVLTFLGLAMATKMVAGEEQLTYYRYEIAALVVGGLLVRLLRQPTLPYMDFTILGTGFFLACGRVGCLMVGCCHGRPHHWGIAYRLEHSAAGFPAYLVGVRLFPVAAVESLWVFGIVIVGAALTLTGLPPGTVLAWYVVSYCPARFWFEFMRGDSGRAYLCGFSEAQWTSVLLMASVSAAELAGLLPLQSWHIAIAAALACTLPGVILIRALRRTPKHKLLHARHVKEVATLIRALSDVTTEPEATGSGSSAGASVHIGSTSLGVRLSGGQVRTGGGHVYHYAFSNRAGNMTRDAAQTLAGLVLQLRGVPSGRSEIFGGNAGVFHLVCESS